MQAMSNDGDLFAYNFGLEVKQRFPSFHSAIGALHKIRKPPETYVDSDHVNTALLALGAIGRAMERPTTYPKNVVLIKQNWDSWIGPWTKFFLNIAEEQSFTCPYPLLFDKVSLVIPKLFLYPDCSRDAATKHTEIVALLKMAPYLLRSATIIWTRTIREPHWTWGHWTGLLGVTFGVNNGSLFAHEVFSKPDELKTIIGSAIRLIHILNRRFRATNRSDGKDLHDLAALLRLFAYLICYRRDSPLPLRPLFVTSGGVKAIVTVHGTLISQQKTFIGEILLSLLNVITFLLDGVLGITDALELGFLVSVFKTGKLQFHGRETFTNMVRDSRHGILETISLYLVYPDVLRHFSKSMRRIIDSGLEKKLEDVRDPFWQCWQQCKEKVVVLGTLKDRMRNPVGLGALVCRYSECPSRKTTSREVPEDFRCFQRCSSCQSAVYCSRACAKNDWRADHRIVCRDRALALKAGKPCVSSRDHASFLGWVAWYVHRDVHGRSILKAFSEFVPPPREPATVGGQGVHMMILQESAHRRGVVVLDFCDRENLNIFSLECFDIRHIDDVLKDPRLQSHPDFVKLLRNSHLLLLDETKIQVLAFFPDTTGGGDCAFPIQEVHKLSQLEGTNPEDGNLSSLGEDSKDDLPQ